MTRANIAYLVEPVEWRTATNCRETRSFSSRASAAIQRCAAWRSARCRWICSDLSIEGDARYARARFSSPTVQSELEKQIASVAQEQNRRDELLCRFCIVEGNLQPLVAENASEVVVRLERRRVEKQGLHRWRPHHIHNVGLVRFQQCPRECGSDRWCRQLRVIASGADKSR